MSLGWGESDNADRWVVLGLRMIHIVIRAVAGRELKPSKLNQWEGGARGG